VGHLLRFLSDVVKKHINRRELEKRVRSDVLLAFPPRELHLSCESSDCVFYGGIAVNDPKNPDKGVCILFRT
jgi:hypothetical protein